eukprot:Amastigsp_a842540_113.p4 type:complete len:153 gc:universal Amastigsp_a842540_113:990-532(-)
MASMTPSTAESRSAESKTMNGDLPPSSSEIFLPEPARRRRRSRPMGVEPVKATLSTSGWSARTEPARPEAVTTLMTPAGTPASAQISAKRSAERRVFDAGLMTTVLPIARAGATFQPRIMSGKFQGMMPATTPTGSHSLSSSAMSAAHPAWW